MHSFFEVLSQFKGCYYLAIRICMNLKGISEMVEMSVRYDHGSYIFLVYCREIKITRRVSAHERIDKYTSSVRFYLEEGMSMIYELHSMLLDILYFHYLFFLVFQHILYLYGFLINYLLQIFFVSF